MNIYAAIFYSNPLSVDFISNAIRPLIDRPSWDLLVLFSRAFLKPCDIFLYCIDFVSFVKDHHYWSEHLSFFEAQNGLRIRGQTTVVSSKETNCATNWNSPYLGWEIALSNSKQCLRGPNENLHQDLSASISILKTWICCPRMAGLRFCAHIRNNGPVNILKAMLHLVP